MPENLNMMNSVGEAEVKTKLELVGEQIRSEEMYMYIQIKCIYICIYKYVYTNFHRILTVKEEIDEKVKLRGSFLKWGYKSMFG